MWKVTVLWQQNVCLPSSVCGSCVAPLWLSDIINELAECQSKCCNHRAEEPTSQGERDGAVFIVTMTDPNLCNSRRWMWRGVISPDPSNSSGTSSFHYFARWGPRDSLEWLLHGSEVTCFTLTVKIKGPGWGWGAKTNSSGVSRELAVNSSEVWCQYKTSIGFKWRRLPEAINLPHEHYTEKIVTFLCSQ